MQGKDRSLEAEEFEEMVKAGFEIGSRWELRDKSAIWKVTAYYSEGCKFINELATKGEPMRPAFMRAERLVKAAKEGAMVRII